MSPYKFIMSLNLDLSISGTQELKTKILINNSERKTEWSLHHPNLSPLYTKGRYRGVILYRKTHLRPVVLSFSL